MTTQISVSTREVADLAVELSADNLEAVVASLPAEMVPVYLARLVDAATNLRTLTKGLERRLVADGQTGQHFTVDGLEYGFFGAVQKGYRDFAGLVRFLIEDCGIAAVAIAESVSDARVTTLREAANGIADAEKRVLALDEIENHRVAKGERGSPRFQLISDYSKGEK